MKTLLVGDITKEISIAALALRSDAKIVTEDNHPVTSDGVYYTSLGDFVNLNSFIDTLESADKLIYSPPNSWSDKKLQQITEFYLLYFYHVKEVIGVSHLLDIDSTQSHLNNMLKVRNPRVTDNPQIWSAGCSFTSAVGVENYQRYGQLIADHTKMPISFLARGGSSIRWSADQILRSDIRENDIVIWGLTNYSRFSYYTTEIQHVNPSYYIKHPEFNKIINIDRLDELNMVYQAITEIYQVINFCKKVNARLLLAGLIVDDIFFKYTLDLPNYLHLTPYAYLDFGTDNRHPGPLTHQYYADKIIKYFQL